MKLELFVMGGCPYCKKVTDVLEREGRAIETYDVLKDSAARRRLQEIGGKIQAPCLFIDSQPLYESEDILSWLSQHR